MTTKELRQLAEMMALSSRATEDLVFLVTTDQPWSSQAVIQRINELRERAYDLVVKLDQLVKGEIP